MTSSPGIHVESARQRGSTSRVPRCDRLIVVTASPGPVYCFNNAEEDAEFWDNTVVAGINETISGKFDQQDYDELYSQANMTEQKFQTFTAGCQSGPSGQYLKYLGTSSVVRDLVSLGDAIVGQGQPIDYWGVSYGTVIGFNFVNSESSGLSIIPAHSNLFLVFPEVLPCSNAKHDAEYYIACWACGSGRCSGSDRLGVIQCNFGHRCCGKHLLTFPTRFRKPLLWTPRRRILASPMAVLRRGQPVAGSLKSPAIMLLGTMSRLSWTMLTM